MCRAPCFLPLARIKTPNETICLPSVVGNGELQRSLFSGKARTVETLEQAIAEALAAITPENASAWFSQRNYGPQ
jgi:hypothetical protein